MVEVPCPVHLALASVVLKRGRRHALERLTYDRGREIRESPRLEAAHPTPEAGITVPVRSVQGRIAFGVHKPHDHPADHLPAPVLPGQEVGDG